MLDLVGAILFTALAVVLVVTLVRASTLPGAQRSRLAVGLSTWFIVVAALAMAGVFSSPVLPVAFAVAIALLIPVIVGSVIVARTNAFGIPLATLVAVHAGRILGVMFLMLFAAGRLPSTFAHSAGWGDIFIGVTALPVAWAVARQVTGWRWITAIWNAIGMLDLLTAVTLGVGSAPGSLVRFIYEQPGSGAVVTLPLVLIPAFFVPLYLLTHIAVFRRLAISAHASESNPRAASGDSLRHLPAR